MNKDSVCHYHLIASATLIHDIRDCLLSKQQDTVADQVL